ncbi:hypothetical protein [Halalkalibacter sp. APA_J-10(15)]|uniref:hypothetical protein n=1 Tax=Halalkalibacter sp. APA_J-10(15) TaxID=2933805 RepID=UPI001FF42878|nr:hypothetical protein [Halalkalibacter sp. APA_J-10(15)]MCK0469844.1 hypothetical protein [Halalkalibacter sp. APA_J-10(15)]
MAMPIKNLHVYLSAISLMISGVLFILYPAIRPFSDEASLQGAAAFASTEWLVSHILAMVAFTLLPLGFYGLLHSLQKPLTYWAFVLCLVGVGLTLPFYGGETFGLYAIGLEAINQQSADLISQADIVRSGVGLILFVIGLLLVAIASVLLTISIWKSDKYQKISGIPLTLGMILYLPQFFFDQPLRVTHGILVAIGCVWISIELWRGSYRKADPKSQSNTVHL